MINWWPPPRLYLLRPTTSSKPNESSTRRPDGAPLVGLPEAYATYNAAAKDIATALSGDLDGGIARMQHGIRLSPRDRKLAFWGWVTPLQPADRGNFRNDFRCLIDPMRTILPEPLFGEAIENSSAYCSVAGLQLIAGRVLSH